MKYLRWLPLVVVSLTIFLLSHTPGDALDLPEITNLDKVLHGIAYLTLASCALLAWHPCFAHRPPLLLGVTVLLFSTLYGISDEWHQSFIPNRSVSGWDVAADAVGAAIAVGCWLHFRRRLPVSRRSR